MLRPSLTALSLVLVATMAGHADAAGGWVPSRGLSPIEQQVAIAASPDRTTLWTSLRFDSAAGAVGVVLPVPDGSSLDWTSDAWLEALEVATALRVFAPEGVSATCPGEPPKERAFHIEGDTSHTKSLPATELLVLDDVATVHAWADLYGLVIPEGLAADLATVSGQRFVVMRFDATGGPAKTPTLRVVMPGAPAMMPLSLTRAAGADLLMTTWVVGPGRAALAGATEASIDAAQLVWNAADGSTSFPDERDEALALLDPLGVLVETSSHEALVKNTAIAGGTATIDGVVTTFFERAAVYGDATGNAPLCTVQAAAALASTSPSAIACPRADLGVVGPPSAPCVEVVQPGEIDPEKLRCGDGADDLAMALSGQTPGAAWLTRQSLLVLDGKAGPSFPVVFVGGQTTLPLADTTSVDVSDCGVGGAGGASSSSSTGATGAGPGSGPGATTGTVGSGPDQTGTGYYDDGPYVHADVGCDCSGTADSSSDYYTDTSSNTQANTSDDSCSGDSSSNTSGGDSCSGDTTSNTSGSDCSGDSGGSSSGDSCDSGGGSGSDSSCDSGSGSSDCTVGQPGRSARRPKLSVVALFAVALLVPLRRWKRKKRAR